MIERGLVVSVKIMGSKNCNKFFMLADLSCLLGFKQLN